MKFIKIIVILVLLAAIVVGAGYFIYDLFLSPEIEERREREERERVVATPTPDPSLAVYENAMELYRQDDLLEAQAALELFIERFPHSPKADEARTLLGDLNMTFLFSPPADEEIVVHEVRSGDALVRIASQHDSTVELIMRANNLQGTLIRPGQQLIIPQADFSLVVDRATERVVLKNHGRFFYEYPILDDRLPAMRAELETQVSEKIAWSGDRRVAFGTPEFVDAVRWIVLARPGFVLFSVAEPIDEEEEPVATVATPASGVKLDPADIDELFALIRNRTPVVIRP